MFRLVQTLVDTMGDVFPEIAQNQKHIERVIKSEEESFNQTLDRGLEIFEQAVTGLKQTKIFPGEIAFKLYDTFGFPLDLTQLLSSEKGMNVDATTFSKLMEAQRERSRESKLHGGISIDPSLNERLAQSRERAKSIGVTVIENEFEFIGYDKTEGSITIHTIADDLLISLKSPFYGESGGQIGDQGIIEFNNDHLHIIDTVKNGKVNIHILESPYQWNLKSNSNNKGYAKVDVQRRLSIMRNHTATHLMHAALRQVLGTHVHQAGSLVAREHLRFDFAHFAKVTDQELAEIENIVNDKIKEKIILQHHRSIPFDEAKKMGALMFFGDKYGDRVNVVQFGEFSKEFCGGTHVKNTDEIGYFKFRSEASSASGVRRVEALTNDYALEFLNLQNKTYKERIEHAYDLIDTIQALHTELGSSSPLSNEEALSLDTTLRKFEDIPDLPKNISPDDMKREFDGQRARFHALEFFILDLSEKKKTVEKEKAKAAVQSASDGLEHLIRSAQSINGFSIVCSKITASDMESLKTLGDTLREKIGSGVGLLAAVIDEKVALVCVVSDDLIKTKNLQAGKIVGIVAKSLSGGGGGKPHLATAGGKDVAKLDDVLRNFSDIVKGMVN